MSGQLAIADQLEEVKDMLTRASKRIHVLRSAGRSESLEEGAIVFAGDNEIVLDDILAEVDRAWVILHDLQATAPNLLKIVEDT